MVGFGGGHTQSERQKILIIFSRVASHRLVVPCVEPQMELGSHGNVSSSDGLSSALCSAPDFLLLAAFFSASSQNYPVEMLVGQPAQIFLLSFSFFKKLLWLLAVGSAVLRRGRLIAQCRESSKEGGKVNLFQHHVCNIQCFGKPALLSCFLGAYQVPPVHQHSPHLPCPRQQVALPTKKSPL